MTDEREYALRCFRDCPVKTVENACDSCEIYELEPTFKTLKKMQEKDEWHQKEAKFMRDYIFPIFTLQFGKILKNYRMNSEESACKADRKAFRQEMLEAGVYDSLRKLQTRGTESDKIFQEFADAIDKKYVNELNNSAYSVFGKQLGELRTGNQFYFIDMHIFDGKKIGSDIGNLYLSHDTTQIEKLVREASALKEDPNPRGPPAAAA